MELSSAQRHLIEKIIKSNPKFIGNEDLLEEFIAETYKRSYLLLDSITNTANLETYLDKVVSTSIQSVLKGYGRMKRQVEGFAKKEEPEPAKEILFEGVLPPTKNKKQPLQDNNADAAVPSVQPQNREATEEEYRGVCDPKENIEYSIAEKAVIQKITNIIYELDSKYPSKEFFKIFYYRYVRGFKQSRIAQEMKLSQGGVSKRMVEMVKLVKERLK